MDYGNYNNGQNASLSLADALRDALRALREAESDLDFELALQFLESILRFVEWEA